MVIQSMSIMSLWMWVMMFGTTIPMVVRAQSRTMTATTAPLLEDNVRIRTDVSGQNNLRLTLSDSYSDGDSCYCSISPLDFGIGNVVVNTPIGILTVRQVCSMLGDGPRGRQGRPLYNDIQCGNGPSNNIVGGGETACPGRMEYGSEGCRYIGPTWNFTALIPTERPTRSPVERNNTSIRTKAPTIKPITGTNPTSNMIRSKAPTRSPTEPNTSMAPTRLIMDDDDDSDTNNDDGGGGGGGDRPPRGMILNLTVCDTTVIPATKLFDLHHRRPTLLDVARIGTTNLTVVADFISATDNVYMIFTWDETYVNNERFPPFTLNGNSGMEFRPFAPLGRVGKHTIVASLYITNTNILLDTLSVDVIVIDSRNTNPGPLDEFYLVDISEGSTQTLSTSVFLDVDELGTSLAIGIETNDDSVASVAFWWDNLFVRREWVEPWTLGGNDKMYFNPSPLLTVPGDYFLTAVAFDSNEAVLGYSGVSIVISNGTSTTQRPLSAPVRTPTRRTPAPSVTTRAPTAKPRTSTTVPPTFRPTTFMPSFAESVDPSPVETRMPTLEPTSAEPTQFPQTTEPTNDPTLQPAVEPTFEPTSDPTEVPTSQPNFIVTDEPRTLEPTDDPTLQPADEPTFEPTSDPTEVPTSQPNFIVTDEPTNVPMTPEPTPEPTFDPTIEPTNIPITPEPTPEPTAGPIPNETEEPSPFPPDETEEPTPFPSPLPTTNVPILVAPTAVPAPVVSPTMPTPAVGGAVITGDLQKWHKITLAFTGPFASETDPAINPFMDYRLDVIFFHESSNKQYIVPGYFAADGNAAESSATSGNQWHCHFSPDETGTWDYEVSFVTGKNVAVNGGGTPVLFDGVTGIFVILLSDKTGRDHRGKGRLQYVGQHHLRFAEGEYFLKAGADSPENFLAYDDFDNTPNVGNRRKSWSPHVQDFSEGDPTWQSGKGVGMIGAINYLSNEGMNVFSFLTMNINGDDKNVFPYISDAQDDRLRMDVSKLAQWEIVFEHGDKMGMFLHFKMGETENTKLLDGGLLGIERKLYYRELIARFSHHLALNWNLSEEITNPVEQIKQFADYIKEFDPYGHNVVFHTGSNSDLYADFLGYPSIDGASLQNRPDFAFSTTLRWVTQSAAAGKKWVVANDEQNSALNGVVPDSVDPNHDNIRENALWGNIMAGGAGVEYYFGYGFPNSDLTCEDYRSRANMWKQSRHALNFFRDNDIKFWEMSNDDSRLPDESPNHVLSSIDGETLIVYRLNSDESEVNMQDLSGSYSVQWYNPREGGPLLAGTITTVVSGTGRSTFFGSAPGSNDQDWVVLLRKL